MSWLDTLEKVRTRDFSKVSSEERDKTARDVINMCSYAVAVVSISPIPLSDLVLMLPIQTGMVVTIGHIYGRKVDQASAKDLILELGTTAGVGILARQGIKALVPVFGAVLTIAPAFAFNWAMGRAAMEYFKYPGMSKELMKEVFKKAQDEAKSHFSKDAFDRFRKQNEQDIHAVANQAQASEEEEEEQEQEEEEAEAPAPRQKTIGKKAAAAKKAPAKKAAAKKSTAKKASTKKAAVEEDEPAEDEPLTVRGLIEQELPRRIKAKGKAARNLNAVIHLDISGDEGGRWTVDLTKPDRWVTWGLKGTPNVTVRCGDEDLLLIATGKKDPKMAAFTGALVFEPLDLALAEQIGQLLA
jgi:uncharacterized protein (DUF697 family)